MVQLLLTFCLLLLPLWESVIVLCFVTFVVRNFSSSIAIILMGKRELVALLSLSSWCLVMVERLFLAVSLGCLRFVIMIVPDHTHLLFLSMKKVPLIWCFVIVVWLFLTMSRDCLQFVIVVFTDHTHLLFSLVKLKMRCIHLVDAIQRIIFFLIFSRWIRSILVCVYRFIIFINV